MLKVINNTIKYGKKHGGFGMQILYPGLILPARNDTGLYTIGRIDHARITPGTLIPMHLHKDDEILTYLRSGKVHHRDSEGIVEVVSPQKLMLMNAGAAFFHEEKVLEEAGVLEGLQIFIRPAVSGLPPKVQFSDLTAYNSNSWRKIAGKGEDYPLQISSDTWLMDVRLEKGASIVLPAAPVADATFLFYVFDGKVQLDETTLNTGESVCIQQEQPVFTAVETSDVVLFMTHSKAAYFPEGMYSGNLCQ